MKLRLWIVAVTCLLACFTISSSAFWWFGVRWAAGTNIVMHLQLGGSGTLLDGSPDWNSPAEAALSLWNGVLNGVSFGVVRNSPAPNASGNGVNNVVFGSDIYGQPFGAGVLAVTLYRYRPTDNTFTEADVVFNTAFPWNSYRGPLSQASTGGFLHDIRRVALHEFGHAIGLDHPDDHGQNIAAVMNSRESNIDSLQTDDINGARSIYGTAPPTPPAQRDTLLSNARLTAGQTLTSNNGRFRLLYQTDGNLVEYDGNTPVWATNTGGTSPGQAIMQNDGNFVVYDGQSIPRFLTGTGGNPGARLVLQGDGNVVIYNAAGQPVWDRVRCPVTCGP